MNKTMFKYGSIIIFSIILIVIASNLIKIKIKANNHKLEELISSNNHKLEELISSNNHKLEEMFYANNTRLAKLEEASHKNIQEAYVNYLKVYKVYDQSGEINLTRLGREGDGGYAVSTVSLDKADVMLGYGVCTDISFEEDFSDKYNKESYGFDCTTSAQNLTIKNKLTHFVPECIGQSANGESTSTLGKFSSFDQQLSSLGLKNKKIFIKMDIEGAEYEALDEILKNASNVTGLVLELHINHGWEAAVDLLAKMNKDFYLVNIHGNNCWSGFPTRNAKGNISELLQLTYVNKNLTSHAEILKSFTHPSNIDTPNCKDKEEHKFEIFQ